MLQVWWKASNSGKKEPSDWTDKKAKRLWDENEDDFKRKKKDWKKEYKKLHKKYGELDRQSNLGESNVDITDADVGKEIKSDLAFVKGDPKYNVSNVTTVEFEKFEIHYDEQSVSSEVEKVSKPELPKIPEPPSNTDFLFQHKKEEEDTG